MLQSSPIRRVQRPFQSSLPLTAVINRLLNPTAPALHLKCKLNTVLFTQRTLYKQKIPCRWKENMQQQKKRCTIEPTSCYTIKVYLKDQFKSWHNWYGTGKRNNMDSRRNLMEFEKNSRNQVKKKKKNIWKKCMPTWIKSWQTLKNLKKWS